MRMGLQMWPVYPSKYGNHFDTLLAVVQPPRRQGSILF